MLLRRPTRGTGDTAVGAAAPLPVAVQVVLCTALLRGSYDKLHWRPGTQVGIGQLLTLVLIGATAWLVVRIAAAIVESTYAPVRRGRAGRRQGAARADPGHADPADGDGGGGDGRGRRDAADVPGHAAAGHLAAGLGRLVGIVAGVAAQSTLGNMFAGLQIAFGDMVRIGDTVVVGGEWGTVEEITLTFLTVRTWDERRITMPVSYFTSKPFENWSRGGTQMTGTVYFQLDHARAAGADARADARTILRSARPGTAAPGAWWSPTPRRAPWRCGRW